MTHYNYRLPNKTHAWGIEINGDSVAYTKGFIFEHDNIVNATIGGGADKKVIALIRRTGYSNLRVSTYIKRRNRSSTGLGKSTKSCGVKSSQAGDTINPEATAAGRINPCHDVSSGHQRSPDSWQNIHLRHPGQTLLPDKHCSLGPLLPGGRSGAAACKRTVRLFSTYSLGARITAVFFST